jgi:hypothetical protein
MGDPAGIGGELTLAAWARCRRGEGPAFVVLDDPARLAALAASLGLDVPIVEVRHPAEAGQVFPGALPSASPRPRLAIAGLNPHAGEGGAMGLEDERIVRPAVDILRAEGIDAFGPLPADTLFHARARAGYDAALCMYHDQALIPAKALAFDEAVNVTLGLPFIRTSPDHGTAFDIAGMAPVVTALRGVGTRVSLFLDPDILQVEAAARLGAGAVELHTGTYCEAPPGPARERERLRLVEAAKRVVALGLECHAGHGLDYETAAEMAKVPEIIELNIGHFLMGQALFDGLGPSIRRMKQVMIEARS